MSILTSAVLPVAVRTKTPLPAVERTSPLLVSVTLPAPSCASSMPSPVAKMRAALVTVWLPVWAVESIRVWTPSCSMGAACVPMLTRLLRSTVRPEAAAGALGRM